MIKKMTSATSVVYSKVKELLKDATLFDLYCLEYDIDCAKNDPKRISRVKDSIKEGDTITYFNKSLESFIDAVVREKEKYRLTVIHTENETPWSISYYALNIDGLDIDAAISLQKLSKHNLKVGDYVGVNNDGTQVEGVITRLNNSTVLLMTRDDEPWLVSYHLLFKIIDINTNTEVSKKILTLACA